MARLSSAARCPSGSFRSDASADTPLTYPHPFAGRRAPFDRAVPPIAELKRMFARSQQRTAGSYVILSGAPHRASLEEVREALADEPAHRPRAGDGFWHRGRDPDVALAGDADQRRCEQAQVPARAGAE